MSYLELLRVGLLLSCGARASHHGDFSCCGTPALGRLGSVALGLCCSATRGILFPDQGSNLCALHWQVDSYPLDRWGSPLVVLLHVTPGHCCWQWLAS